ncbi:thioredoxin superfamily protein [Artemisia annua]|uniref:Thioredoxin superfamily protein n=1 Tax=Artemisia annua TaxID=35608 RepID=A0A2U1PAL2_ARTAN|nr:thioredoxin superfamily protein [Artemisia annua]
MLAEKKGVPDLSEFGDAYDLEFGLGVDKAPTSAIVKKELQREIIYHMSPHEDYTLASMLLRPGVIQALLDARFPEADECLEKVPRVYIKTMYDKVVKPHQQDNMIAKWTPSQVYVLESDYLCYVNHVQARAFSEQTNFKGEVYADPSYASYKALNFVSGVTTTFTPGEALKIIEAYMEGYRQDWELSFEKDTRTKGGWQQGGIIVAGPGISNISYIHRDKEAVIIARGKDSSILWYADVETVHSQEDMSTAICYVNNFAMEHEKAQEFIKGKRVVVVGFQKQLLDIAMECSSVNG